MQQYPLLVTKFYIPQIRSELVSRPRLIKRLDAGLGQNDLQKGLHFARRLTLVSAPAGFGKTTLVSDWVHAMEDETLPTAVAWLSLDEGDNDPVRFLTYCIAALNQIEGIGVTFGKGVLGMLQSSQPAPVEAILTALINEMAALQVRMILVLDDYHLIDAQSIHDVLTFLLEHLPPQLHLVIVTRDDPHLPIARLRVRGQLIELRAVDLRFTSSEAAEFLTQVMGLDLSVEDIDALETRTEGWIAGLQLAAIALQGTISIPEYKDTATLIKYFTGSHRFVLDYLIEEVLEQQSDSIQTFLLQTAVLNRLTGSLCDALTGQDNGQATLVMLEHANLFIRPLDEERHWYRYHHLFADLLHQRLKQTYPEKLQILNRSASEWYEQNGFVDEAIEHALRVDDFERAASLIAELVDDFWRQGDHAKMRRLLLRLPIELVVSKPHLCIFHAWYSFVSGQQDLAEQCLQAVQQALDSSSSQNTETKPQKQDFLSSRNWEKLQGRLAAIRVYMYSHHGDVPGMIQYAQQALEYLPEQDRTWRSTIEIALGDVYGFKGDMTAAYKARFEAWKASKANGDIYFSMLATVKLVITLRCQGHLQRTMEMCQQQIQYAHDWGLSQTPLNGLLLIIWAEVLAELNDLDGAKQQAEKGTELTGSGVDLTISGWGYMCLMRILFSRGELAGIEEIIQKIKDIDRESNVPPWIMNQITSWHSKLWLLEDKLSAASQWAREHNLYTDSENKPHHEITFFSLLDYLVLARIRIAKGHLNEAIELLYHLLTAAETGGRTSRAIEILILLALAMQSQGNIDRALTVLEQALTLAESEGFIRTFVDEGTPMAHLLCEALSRGIAPDYVRRLLATFPMDASEQTDASQRLVPNTGLVESLSERELQVLHLVADGLTNPEIASKLYLSLNTVKVHTRNIYGKLGVHNRMQAVVGARALGLLPPS